MSELNPYQSPTTPTDQWQALPGSEVELEQAAFVLSQTKPWVRFLSVLWFLLFGIMILAFVGIALAATPNGAGGPPVLVSVMFLPFGLIFLLIPALLLWNYASRIAMFLVSQNPQSLAAAVGAQKSFWKYLGVVSAIITVIYALAILVRLVVYLGGGGM
jgi:hypothetical protein